jgi:hypothetical protein
MFLLCLKVVRILQARAEKLVVGPKGRYRGSESREEELHEHLFYSQVSKGYSRLQVTTSVGEP